MAGLLARGLGNRAIAAEFVNTEAMAERHIRNIFDKLGLASRAQLAIWAPHRPTRIWTADQGAQASDR